MGFESVRMLREKHLETLLNGQDAMLLVYEGEVLVSALNLNTKFES